MAAKIDQNLVELLQKLISVPSVNPELTDDPSIGGEARMADCLGRELERRGFSVERGGKVDGRPNVVGRRPAGKRKKSFLVESHLDTQGIHGMTVAPFGGVVKDGRLYGRGACDMKGPLAAALHALSPDVLDALSANGVELIFVGAMGEERGNLGAVQLVADGLGADEALVLEPTGLNIVQAHKGAFWFEIETKGIAAHGSTPERGLNAIDAMSEVIAQLHGQTSAAREKILHPTLGAPTSNIGRISGGTSTNIVADRCVIEVDRRTLPGESSDEIMRNVEQLLARMEAARRIAGWSVRRIKEGLPFETPPDSPLIQRLLAACRAHAAHARVEGAAWYSDAGPFSQTCGAIAVFGPGSIAQAHTADEYIELQSLQDGCEILKLFFQQLAGRP